MTTYDFVYFYLHFEILYKYIFHWYFNKCQNGWSIGKNLHGLKTRKRFSLKQSQERSETWLKNKVS